jgi:predicted GIY-YIG superfamily endonuclease
MAAWHTSLVQGIVVSAGISSRYAASITRWTSMVNRTYGQPGTVALVLEMSLKYSKRTDKENLIEMF